jgi:hypothetical protein
MTRRRATSLSRRSSHCEYVRPAIMRHGVRAVPATVAGAALTALAASIALYVIDPSSTRVPLCPLHAFTGLWCPFCGSTRAAHSLLHGDFGTALHDNILFMCAIPVVTLVGLYRASSGRPLRHPLPPVSRWTLLGLATVFMVLRNLPAGSWLAPVG